MTYIPIESHILFWVSWANGAIATGDLEYRVLSEGYSEGDFYGYLDRLAEYQKVNVSELGVVSL